MSDITRDYSFGGWFRHLRIQQGHTLRAAAKKLKMDAGNLSKLERSELDPPMSAEKILKWSIVLGFQLQAEFLASLAYQHHLSSLKTRFGGISR